MPWGLGGDMDMGHCCRINWLGGEWPEWGMLGGRGAGGAPSTWHPPPREVTVSGEGRIFVHWGQMSRLSDTRRGLEICSVPGGQERCGGQELG